MLVVVNDLVGFVLPGPLPLGKWALNVTWLPCKKIYSSRTTEQDFFLALQFLSFSKAVIKSRGAGHFPRLLWTWSPATFIGKQKKNEAKENPSCLIPCLLIIYYFYPATWNRSDNPALVKICILNVRKNVSYGIILIPITKESLNFFFSFARYGWTTTDCNNHCWPLLFLEFYSSGRFGTHLGEQANANVQPCDLTYHLFSPLFYLWHYSAYSIKIVSAVNFHVYLFFPFKGHASHTHSEDKAAEASHSLEETSKVHSHVDLLKHQISQVEPDVFIGLSLVCGFVFMLLIDHISGGHSHAPSGSQGTCK